MTALPPPTSPGRTGNAPARTQRLPRPRLANTFHFKLVNAALRACLDLRVEGGGHLRALPPGSGFVLAANHLSHFDPPILSIAAEHWIDWLAMVELYRGPVASAFWNALGAIPVDRAQRIDRAAASTALHRLKAGRAIGIFPERGIRTGAESVLAAADTAAAAARLDHGACRLALGARVPVVPAVIEGSENLYAPGIWLLPRRAATVTVRFGPPLHPDPIEGYGKQGAVRLHGRLAAALLALGRRG